MNGDRPEHISKVLSRNDTGETGAHQSGILIPKDQQILSFFPTLGTDTKNPRHILTIRDEFEDRWTFAFIYYNNRYFGGTRNEYRLTRMTPFIKSQNLKAGDTITLIRDRLESFHITYSRLKEVDQNNDGILRLGTTWKVVKI
jgi:hypothetical protein